MTIGCRIGCALLFLAGCASPEAGRLRGGGPGADIGNRGRVAQFHAGARPYFATPCLMRPQPCEETPQPPPAPKRD